MYKNVLPGLMCSSVEFFVVENVVKAINHGKVIDFNDIPIGIVELLREEINKDENVKISLFDMQPDSEWKRLEQFVKCRFGGLDFQGDIKEGNLQDGEFLDCPLRGTCTHEGVVCKLPVVNQYRLNSEDIKLMQLSSTEKTNEVIIDEMQIPAGTFHKHKAALHQNLKVQTKQGIAIISKTLGLI